MPTMTAEQPRTNSMRNVVLSNFTALVPADFQPAFLLRFASVLVDYMVLLIFPLAGLLSEKFIGGSGLGLVTDRTLWFFSIILAGANAVLLPLLTRQTAGMFLTGIRIVRYDGSDAGAMTILARQTIGYLLTLGTLGLGFLISAINTSGRTLHDFVTGTALVRASKRFVST